MSLEGYAENSKLLNTNFCIWHLRRGALSLRSDAAVQLIAIFRNDEQTNKSSVGYFLDLKADWMRAVYDG
jgi:hypothetical protein